MPNTFGIAKDITEIKRIQRETIKQREIHKILTDNSLDIIIHSDIQGRILYVSPAATHILGYTSEELLRKELSIFIHPEDLQKAKECHNRLLCDSNMEKCIYRLLSKKGSYIWTESLSKAIVDNNTERVEVISVLRDITDRKKAELNLKIREETYRNIVEQSADAIIIVRDGIILYINQTGMDLFKSKGRKEIIGHNFFNFVHPDFTNLMSDVLEMSIKGGNTDITEQKYIRLDGSIIEAEVKTAPTIFNDKFAVQITIRDIAERKKTHELILNSEKLSMTGKLAAAIAHEIKNPLTAIKGFHQLMRSSPEKADAYLDIISSEMERMEGILNELLLLAKPHKRDFRRIRLMEIITEVITLLNSQAVFKSIVINFNYKSNEDVLISGDRNQLKQVFINFIKNSIEAINDDGKISIVLTSRDNEAHVIITDNGCGIPTEVLHRIGEPFFTTKESGTGLGIMISKQIIENHKGKLDIQSDNSGTTIKVNFPIN